MTPYAKIFMDQLKRLEDLNLRRERIEDQISKVKQVAAAAFPLMSTAEQAKFAAVIETVNRSSQTLTQAIRRILAQSKREYLSASQIRKRLEKVGYDFSTYTSNPLVSIHSVLNRLNKEVEVMTIEGGVKGYRLIERGRKL